MRSEIPFELAADWDAAILGDVCDPDAGLQTGPFGSQLHADDYVALGIPSIMPQDLVDGQVDERQVARITEEDARRLSRYRVQAGDIVYSRRGDISRRALITKREEGWLCGTGCLRVRAGDDLDSEYLFRYLGHPAIHNWLERHAVGATMPNLNTKILAALPIAVPPRNEQRRMSQILAVLDGKIESNRRIANTLEEIAATLFEARFVDFVDQDDLVESEIGQIPRGWSTVTVGDLARYVNGKAFTKFGNGRGRMVIRIAELRSGPGHATVYTDYETEPDFVARAGDVLFAWSGSLDVYRWYGEESLINQHIFKVIPEGCPAWLVFYALKHVMPHFQAIAADKATTMGHIKRSHLSEYAVAVPPDDQLAKYDPAFAPIFERALRARVEIEILARIRDALLPRLISGQIRIPATDSTEPPP